MAQIGHFVHFFGSWSSRSDVRMFQDTVRSYEILIRVFKISTIARGARRRIVIYIFLHYVHFSLQDVAS